MAHSAIGVPEETTWRSDDELQIRNGSSFDGPFGFGAGASCEKSSNCRHFLIVFQSWLVLRAISEMSRPSDHSLHISSMCGVSRAILSASFRSKSLDTLN